MRWATFFVGTLLVYFGTPVFDEVAERYDFSFASAQALTPGSCTANVTADGASTLSLTAPAHSDGDLLVLFAAVQDVATYNETLEVETIGWTTRGSVNTTTNTDRAGLVATKVASSEAGSYVVDEVSNNASTTALWNGFVCAFSDVHVDVLDQTTVIVANQSDSITADPPAITTLTDGAFVIAVCGPSSAGTDPTDVTPPTNYTQLVDASEPTDGGEPHLAAFYREIATAGAEDPGTCGGYGTVTDHSLMTLALKAAVAAAGVYDTTPTVTSQTATVYTIGGSLDASGTIDAVACPKDQTAPTIAQVQAGNCTGDVAAMATATASPAMTPFDFSETLTLVNGFRIADLYITDGTNLTTLADEPLDCPASSNCVTLTGAPTTDPLVQTDCTTGDLVRIDSLTTPDGYATNVEADGSMQYFAGGDLSRQIFDGDCYDVSAEALDLYD